MATFTAYNHSTVEKTFAINGLRVADAFRKFGGEWHIINLKGELIAKTNNGAQVAIIVKKLFKVTK